MEGAVTAVGDLRILDRGDETDERAAGLPEAEPALGERFRVIPEHLLGGHDLDAGGAGKPFRRGGAGGQDGGQDDAGQERQDPQPGGSLSRRT